jgi:hypothetical protein
MKDSERFYKEHKKIVKGIFELDPNSFFMARLSVCMLVCLILFY